MKTKTLPVIALMIGICSMIMSECKKNDSPKSDIDTPTQDEPILRDSAKIIYIGQRDYPNYPTGSTGTIISSYDAATGALINTLSYLHDPKSASYDSALQFISLQAGNGFLYDIESDKINAVDMNTGAIRWTDSVKNNNGVTLHGQTFYGISIGGIIPSDQIASTNNFVYALDATKPTTTYLWKYPISLAGIASLNVPNMFGNIPNPVYYNGLIYVMADATHLIALNAATGTLKWTFTFPLGMNTGNPYYTFTKPLISNGTIYSSVFKSSTYLINAATGAQKLLLPYIGTPFAVANNWIISDSGAYDATTGSPKWNAVVGDVFGVWNDNVVSQRDSFYYSYPPGAPHSIFNISISLKMYYISTGQQKWTHSFSNGSGINNCVIVSNTLYACGGNDLTAMDLYTGKAKWFRSGIMPYSVDAVCVIGLSGNSYTPRVNQ